MVSPLSVILEARGKKKNEITPSEGEDYTKDELKEDNPETDAEEEKNTDDPASTEVEPEATDYTSEEPEEDVDDEPETADEVSDEELSPTDYTSEDPDPASEGEGDEPEETGDGTGEEGGGDDVAEPTDYTSEDPDPDADTEEPSTDDTVSTEPESDGGAISPEDEKRKKKELFYDYIQLYELIKSFIAKLSSQANNTIFVNKILIQINKNLNDSRRSIWNFIIYEFDKNNYVTNLTKYNFFVENIRINIEMVHKVKDYLSNSETFK